MGMKVRGMALKAGTALHAELRAAANIERRTAKATTREKDCMLEMPLKDGKVQFSNAAVASAILPRASPQQLPRSSACAARSIDNLLEQALRSAQNDGAA